MSGINKSYRETEICPYCGNKLKHKPSYWEECFGRIESEYGLECDNCGMIDYYCYGNWDGDIDGGEIHWIVFDEN